MKPILVIPSNTLTASEKKNIEDAGYLTIVTDEPDKIKFIKPDEESMMGMSQKRLCEVALSVIYSSTAHTTAETMRDWFVRIVFSEMKIEYRK